MSDPRGLFPKYTVSRTERSDKHINCDYFVLDLTHDPIAREAAMHYAALCRETRPQLSADLFSALTGTEEGD